MKNHFFSIKKISENYYLYNKIFIKYAHFYQFNLWKMNFFLEYLYFVV